MKKWEKIYLIGLAVFGAAAIIMKAVRKPIRVRYIGNNDPNYHNNDRLRTEGYTLYAKPCNIEKTMYNLTYDKGLDYLSSQSISEDLENPYVNDVPRINTCVPITWLDDIVGNLVNDEFLLYKEGNDWYSVYFLSGDCSGGSADDESYCMKSLNEYGQVYYVPNTFLGYIKIDKNFTGFQII